MTYQLMLCVFVIVQAHPAIVVATMQVVAVLEGDDHFTKLSEDKWGLAIYKPLRWGFAGTGKIAEDFIEALSLVPGAQLVTAAARKKDRLPQAQEFAKKHGTLSTCHARLCKRASRSA